jgi:hypothetical protein
MGNVGLNYLIDHGCDVKVLLVPYHPQAYNIMTEDSRSRLIFNIEDYYRKLAVELNIEIIGSFDPSRMDVGENMFRDESHPKDAFYSKALDGH